MNAKKAKSMRSQCTDRKTYKHLKKVNSAQALTNASQAPKPINVRAHKQKDLIPATWPRTPDQRKQSRPLIVLRPVRAQRIAFERAEALAARQ
jgi:hypothetical protein